MRAGKIADMRIVAGYLRGRQLSAPPGLATRPILDRVKVALFDWLGARLATPGTLPEVNVLDIFCGGGSLGIESLSRGAIHCTFVDSDRAALACLKENISALDIADQTLVISAPADSLRIDPADDLPPYSLIFCDPPYRLSDDVTSSSTVGKLLARLGDKVPVTDDCLLVWRHDGRTHIPAILPGRWSSCARREWGTMAVTLLERVPQAPSR